MEHKTLRLSFLILLIATLSAGCATGNSSPKDTVIRNVTIVDGTGTEPFVGSVRISGDSLTEVGEVSVNNNDLVIPGDGLVLAPGFIDTHSHHDEGLLLKPAALGAISQGITTIIIGQDGRSYFPLDKYFTQLEQSPVAVNIASYTGHNTLRTRAMTADFQRAATLDEVEQMAQELEADLRAGSFGLATGLEYDPGIYSDTEEVLTLATVAAENGGRYISHIRSEDRYFWEAVDEILTIGKEAKLPVHISHAKLAMRRLWGQTDRLLTTLNAARRQGVDVTLDVYPYDYWQSTLRVLFPDRDFDSLDTAELVLSDIAPADGITLVEYRADPTLAGQSLAQIAASQNIPPAQALLDLINNAYEDPAADTASTESMLGRSMRESDIVKLLQWPYANVCSDGDSNGGHPRGFGAFPRVLSRFVRTQNQIPLAEAIHKMTLQSAQNVGITDRGWIGPGAFADLVLFDLKTVKDNASINNPQALASGINWVWVNGQLVYTKGVITGRKPGQVIRRGR